MALKKSSELRQQEHVNSRQFHVKFDGTAETCPYKVGDLYDGRIIISLGFNTTLYGHTYHLIVERDRTHLRTKFVFDEKHDIKFSYFIRASFWSSIKFNMELPRMYVFLLS